MNAFEPVIPEEVLTMHYETHHQGHVDYLNENLPILDLDEKYLSE